MKKNAESSLYRLIKQNYPIHPHFPLHSTKSVNNIKFNKFSISELLNSKNNIEKINNKSIMQIIKNCSRKQNFDNKKENCNQVRHSNDNLNTIYQKYKSSTKLNLPILKIRQNKQLSQENIHLQRSESTGDFANSNSMRNLMHNNGANGDIKTHRMKPHKNFSEVHIKSFAIYKKIGKNTRIFTSLRVSKNLCDNIIVKKELNSKILGKISLFGILDGHGENGKIIAKFIKKFLISHFESSLDIRASLNRDNYYTILSQAFDLASKELKIFCNYNNINGSIQNKTGAIASPLPILDCNFSGTNCILLLFPLNNPNKLFCANVGDSRCILYSITSLFPLSYDHKPNVPSERERIKNMGGQICSAPGTVLGPERVFIKGENYPGLGTTRSIGDFIAEEIGVTSSPEVIECDLEKESGKFIVMASEVVWSNLSNEEIGKIVREFYKGNNVEGASKAIGDSVREKLAKNNKKMDDFDIIVLFLSAK